MNINKIKEKINTIKKQLSEIDDFRPGSLTKQSRKSKKEYGSYWHLSYTHQNKGHTEYICSECVSMVKIEVQNYKKFKKLIDEWIDLSIEKSKLKIKLIKEKKNK